MTMTPDPLPGTEATQWQALPPQAAQVAMIAGTLQGVLLGTAAAVFAGWPLRTALELSWLPWLGIVALLWLLLVVAVIWLGYLRWKFTAWKLDATGLQLRRGKWWRREILVPRSRVQHLDIERGPIERHFGLATLVVHTAGTRLHALRQAGFLDADAVALRDALVPASDRHDDVL